MAPAHAIALGLGQPGDFARHAERGESVDAIGDEEIDDPTKAVEVDVAGS